MDELDFRPEIWAIRLPCERFMPLGPITKTLDRFIISSLALHVFLFPLVASPSFADVLPWPVIAHPSFRSPSPAAIRPSLSFFFFFSLQPEGQCFIMIYQPVMCSGHDSSTDGLMKYTLFFFFSPAVPHLPIKHRLSLSNWCLSWWRCVILKFGDFRCCRAGCDTGNSYSWFFEFVASHKS